MAGIKISELPATTIILEDDQLILSRGDSTRRVSGNQFLTRVQTAELSASIASLSSTTSMAISALTVQTFTTISLLSSTTTTTFSSLSTQLYAKKRWADFMS
jgi:hypothetical protein